MLDYETKMAEIRRKQEEKLDKQRQKEMERENDIHRKRLEVFLFCNMSNIPRKKRERDNSN